MELSGFDSVLLCPVENKHILLKFHTGAFHLNNDKGSGSTSEKSNCKENFWLNLFMD